MTQPTGIDQSWSFADPATAAEAGIEVVSMYLSRDPSKNATPAKIKAYHEHGIAVLLNWESMAGAPLSGAGQGREDATDAIALVRSLFAGVGYKPRSRLCIPFSCDRDTNPTQYPSIDGYYGATKPIVNAADVGNGVYGEADLIEHLHAAGLTEMEWQAAAWSGGRLSPEADFYQFLNTQHMGGASVDYDRVIHARQMGAWWPPGHRFDAPAHEIKPDLLEEIMSLDRNSADYKRLVSDIADAVVDHPITTKAGTKSTVGALLGQSYEHAADADHQTQPTEPAKGHSK